MMSREARGVWRRRKAVHAETGSGLGTPFCQWALELNPAVSLHASISKSKSAKNYLGIETGFLLWSGLFIICVDMRPFFFPCRAVCVSCPLLLTFVLSGAQKISLIPHWSAFRM